MEINILETEELLAVPLADHGLLQCENDVAQDWVTYQYRMPSKLAEWIAGNLADQSPSFGFISYQIPANKEAKWTLVELDQI